MRIRTIKRYLEHYPAGFIAKKVAQRLVAPILSSTKPTLLSVENVSIQNAKFFALPRLPKEKQSAVKLTANKLVKGVFQVYSIEHRGKIDWSKDYVNNKRFGEASADIRIVWELNRLHFLVWLAEAQAANSNPKYAACFKKTLVSWMDKNPPEAKGPNWRSPMEAAIRAINLCHAFPVFYRAIDDVDFWRRFFSLLFRHGEFIFNNLEWSPKIRGNHYLCNLVGLLYLGILFEKTPAGRKWLDFAHKELQKEIQYQVMDDGVDFEKSTWYHGFATEIFFTAYTLMKQHKMKVEKTYEKRLSKMFEFLNWITRSDGTMPLIGDSDSGRLLRLYQANGFEDLLTQGKKFLKHQPIGLKVFDKSGFCIYRNRDIFLTFFAGPTGTLGTGGHTHNSALAFTLDINDKPIFIDPGTYVYTGNAAMRNLFRSTAYHNTLMVDSAEQNYLDQKDLFKLFDKTRSEVTFAEKVKNRIVIAGRHYGYEDRRIVHERLISIDPAKREISIRDWLSGKGVHNLQWNFHVADNKVKLCDGSVQINGVKFKPQFPAAINLKNTAFSDEFGQKSPGKAISMPLERVLMSKMFHFIITY